MRITIKATGFDLTEALRTYVEQKVGALEKFISIDDIDALVAVEIGKMTSHHRSGDIYKAEINITRAGSGLLREVVTDANVYRAIDKVKDSLTETLAHAHQKRVSLFRKGGRVLKQIMRGLYNQ